LTEWLTNAQGNTNNETYRKNEDLEDSWLSLVAIHWYKGKWQAAILVSTLNATKQRTDNIRSNLYTGQYAGSVSMDHRHSQGQVLVEPLLVLLGVTGHINKFLCLQGHSKKGEWTWVLCKKWSSVNSAAWLRRFDGVAKTNILRW